jgi:hypothetical protein
MGFRLSKHFYLIKTEDKNFVILTVQLVVAQVGTSKVPKTAVMKLIAAKKKQQKHSTPHTIA